MIHYVRVKELIDDFQQYLNVNYFKKEKLFISLEVTGTILFDLSNNNNSINIALIDDLDYKLIENENNNYNRYDNDSNLDNNNNNKQFMLKNIGLYASSSKIFKNISKINVNDKALKFEFYLEPNNASSSASPPSWARNVQITFSFENALLNVLNAKLILSYFLLNNKAVELCKRFQSFLNEFDLMRFFNEKMVIFTM